VFHCDTTRPTPPITSSFEPGRTYPPYSCATRLPAWSSSSQADPTVVGAPDLGPHHVAEAPVDARVQVERFAHPEQIGRNHRADAAARPPGLAGAMLVMPKLLREIRIASAGAVVGDRMAGIASAG
jgi:hypothetical protein